MVAMSMRYALTSMPRVKKSSPGSYLFRSLLEALFERGLSRYYMGPGENAYKLRWTEQAEPTQRAIVYNRTLRGRLAWASTRSQTPFAVNYAAIRNAREWSRAGQR